MKTTCFSVLKKALSVFLACLMAFCCLAASFPALRADAANYGFTSESTYWATGKNEYGNVIKWLPYPYMNSGWTSLLVVEVGSDLYALASVGSTDLGAYKIQMQSTSGGAAKFMTEDVDNGNSTAIDNTYYMCGYLRDYATCYFYFASGQRYVKNGTSTLQTSASSYYSLDYNGYLQNTYFIFTDGNYGYLSDSGTYRVRAFYDNHEIVSQVSLTYYGNGATGGSVDTQYRLPGDTISVKANGFTKTGYTFSGWNTNADGTGTPYAAGDTFQINSNMALYAQWGLNTYTVTWKNADGTTLETDTNVPYGATPSYDGATPTQASNAQYTYTFAGWSPSVSTVTGDVTYTATYTQTVNKYTVTWKNADGTTLETDTNVPYGATPSYDSATPSKAATAQYTYTFAGWSPSVSTVTGDVTYTAAYTQAVNKYTVTWKNADGTTLETDTNVPYGATPSYDGATPTQAANAQYTYTFAGWSPSVSTVTGDVTYTATYSQALNKYTVIWKDFDGAELEKDENVPYGTAPEYNGETPSRETTAQYTYAFAGWSPSVSAVTGDATYTATYNSTLRKYTVLWQNWDGAELEKDENVPYGTVPSYDGETPVRQGNAQYTYTFIGWTPETTEDPIQGDVIFEAVFRADTNAYTVYWKNWDGTELEKDENVPYGETPEYNGETPARPANAQYTYTFDYWTPAISDVTGDVTYTAHFTETLNKYTVTWKNGDTVLETDENVEYGTMPAYNGETPAQAADAQYTYSFVGWSPEVDTVTGDAAYTAVFSSHIRSYQITFLDADGHVLQNTSFKYGTIPVFSGETPEKEDTAEYDYTFAGWDHEIAAVTGEATYTATYRADKKSYTISFVDADGTVLQDTAFEYGELPVFSGETPEKEDTAEYDYTFAGWDHEIAAVTGEATYTATYRADKKSYTITWVNEDGTPLFEDTVEYGLTPVYGGATPEKEPTEALSFTFAGWDPEVVPVTGDKTYTAKYSSGPRTYTVTWLDADGSLLRKDTGLAWGAAPSYGPDPEKEDTAEFDYSFAGWTPAVIPVAGEATYTASYTAEKKSYTVTFKNEDGTVLQDTAFEYGEMPVYSGETPEKAADAQYAYVFDGWTPEISEVTGEAAYTAMFRAVAHPWVFTGFTWTGNDEDGYTAAVANYVCNDGETRYAAVDAVVTPVYTAPTCETPGRTVYTASVSAEISLDGKEHSEDKTVPIAAAGHDWAFTGFTWTGNPTDGYAAVANYVCNNGTAHCGTAVASVTAERAEPTCTEPGSAVYTALVTAENSLDGAEHTDVMTVALPALGHNWGPWTVVRDATFEEDGLERRECRRCGAVEERAIVWEGNATREIQFVVSFPMHYVASVRGGDHYVFSDTTPVLYWYPEIPLKFRVEVYTTWNVTGYIVAANGRALRPDADGVYTIPAGTERVVITCDPTTAPQVIDEIRCPYCGNIHPDTVWGFLIGMVHQLFAMFRKLGR